MSCAALELFCEAETASVPPHLDPRVAGCWAIYARTDTDHVGAGEVGRVGNNRLVHVLIVTDRSGAEIYAAQFATSRAAFAHASELERAWSRARQNLLNFTP